MCGIVGFCGKKEAKEILLSGLSLLEYRGYDSAGLALISPDGCLSCYKTQGRVDALKALLAQQEHLVAHTGIAHTRWATHGVPSDINAHPHMDDEQQVAIVHNGIIENYLDLKDELIAKGHHFASETDSEVIAHLVADEYKQHKELGLLHALVLATRKLEGSWAIACVAKDNPQEIVCARKGSPVVLAETDEGAYVASDVTALSGVTKHCIQLQDGQFARLRATGAVEVFDDAEELIATPTSLAIDWDTTQAELSGFSDFMEKEIAEQPESIERLLNAYVTDDRIHLDELNLSDEELAQYNKIMIVSCGTSYHVAMIAKRYIESWAKTVTICDYASEFIYQDALVDCHTLGVVITQSGETADTLAAARKMRAMGASVIAITNVLGSTATAETDGAIFVKAGPEICVASTKAYTAQVVAACLFALKLAEVKKTMSQAQIASVLKDLAQLPKLIQSVIDRRQSVHELVPLFQSLHSCLFLGRGLEAITAFEGALKLKELSYIHAEAYPAGEMKHGPIALLEPGFVVVVIAANDRVRAKTMSNMQEVIARGATSVCLASDGDTQVSKLADHTLWLPACANDELIPIFAIVYLQYLARACALARGFDVDKPRNLAKSVTVE